MSYRRIQSIALLLCALFTALPALAADALRIGVLAYRGKERAVQEWQAHADYLSQKLAPQRFQIVPLTLEEFPAAIDARNIDLVITNTGHYVELEAGGRIARFATLRTVGPKGPIDKFGGTAFTRSGQTDIQRYADLRQRRIATPSRSGFGGWQVHQREALAQGVDLNRDVARVIETQSHDKTVEAVLDGEADVGFVRSDLLETMAANGQLDLSRVQVINLQTTAGYPYLHSTRLYPHWPFARLDHVPESQVRDVLIALLQITPGLPAAKAANIHGWTLGHNYQPVHDLFLELRLPPYDTLPVTVKDLMARYGSLIAGSAAFVIALLLAALWIIAHGNAQLKRTQGRLRLAAGVFEHAQEGILITDIKGDVVDVNDTFLSLTGYTRTEVLGHNPRFLASGRQDADFYKGLWRELTTVGAWRGDLWNRRKDGSLYVQQTSISAVRDTAGRITHYIGLSYDVTALKQSQEQLEQMAYFDALTGLPNRRLLADRLKQAIAQANRTEKLLAICYLDLDGFKPINDNWGHAAGDRLLIEAAGRLGNAVRSGDTISRLGGDEFVVLLSNLAHVEECEHALERIREALCAPYYLVEGSAQLSASIGVTLYPIDASDLDTLIRHADQAMYAAKQAGRNRFQLFDAGGDRISEARRSAFASVRQAIDQDEFLLYFQPKVNMRTGEVIGAEALLRWQHPERGFLNPGEFLPVVDFVGMQTAVGDWVLRTAIRQIAAWADAGFPQMSISINVAAEQLQHSNFIDKLRAVLAEFPVAHADQIELELLETAALHDLTEVSGVIDRCRELGVHFAIDDFGTGYSSLTYLKQLHARTLKVDQSFVRDMLDDPEDLAIVDGIVGLASAFRRQVVAEGVETVAHGRMLLQLGCELAQGYGIARPMPAERLMDWIAQWKQPAEWRKIDTWSREDLPLLTMEIEHQRWHTEFQRAIAEVDPKTPGGPASALPPLDPQQCRFGRWLESSGRRRYSHLLAFRDLEASHNAVHEIAQNIAKLWHRDPMAARLQLDELTAHREALVAALDELRVMALGHH